MQTDEQQIFRFNWQVGVIAGVTIVMLIIPLAGVVLCIQHFLQPKAPAVMQQPELPFRKSLEDIANQKLGSQAVISSDRNSIELQAGDVATEVSRITDLAKTYGGVALPADTAEDQAKLTIQIPENQLDGFSKACQDSANAPKPTTPDNSSVLVEVLIKTKKP